MPAEDPHAAPPELYAQPPAERPARLGHDLQLVHLGDALRRHQRLVRFAEEEAPASQLHDRAAEPRFAAFPAQVELGLPSHGVGVGLDEVRPCRRWLEAPRRPAQPQGPQ